MPRNLLNCNKYRAKCSFLPLKASRFGIKSPSKNHVFSSHPPGPHFSPFYVDLGWKSDFGIPFWTQLAPKWHPKSVKWRQNGEKSIAGVLPFSRPETDLCPRGRPKRPAASFFMIFDDFGTFQGIFLMIFSDLGTLYAAFPMIFASVSASFRPIVPRASVRRRRPTPFGFSHCTPCLRHQTSSPRPPRLMITKTLEISSRKMYKAENCKEPQRTAKNRQEPAKNQPRTSQEPGKQTKTSRHEPQFCNPQRKRQPPINAVLKTARPKTGGGGGVTPHGVFNKSDPVK